MMQLSIVIPCYNEEKNIPLMLSRFSEVINRDDVEVVLVNNGSQDNTAQVLAEVTPSYPFARVTTLSKNQGYGFGILSGLLEARGEYLGWTHADMQTDPSDSIKALNIIEKEGRHAKIYVKGSRMRRPLLDNIFTVGMSIFETVYMGAAMWDINAQPNIFHRSFLSVWDTPPYDFSLDLYALYMAKRNNLNIKRFPVIFPERIHGESSWNTGLTQKWKFIKRTISFSTELKARLRGKA